MSARACTTTVLLRRRILLLGHRSGRRPGVDRPVDCMARQGGYKGKRHRLVLRPLFRSRFAVNGIETSKPTRLPFAILNSGIAQAKCDRAAGGLTGTPREADQTLAKSRDYRKVRDTQIRNYKTGLLRVRLPAGAPCTGTAHARLTPRRASRATSREWRPGGADTCHVVGNYGAFFALRSVRLVT
jgi:hypothetical protein